MFYKITIASCFMLFASSSFASWTKIGSDDLVYMYYDRDKVELVDYRTEKGNRSKGIRIKTLYNFKKPLKCFSERCFDEVVNSVFMVKVYDCKDGGSWEEEHSFHKSSFADGKRVDYSFTRNIEIISDWGAEKRFYGAGKLTTKMLKDLRHLCK